MKLAAVILNYNDADETIEAVRRISGFESLSTIIVVDNASTDDSASSLRTWLRAENRRLLMQEESSGEDDDEEDEPEQFHRYMLVQAEKNGGYGYGNNLGVQYAYENASAELVLIANPDAVFTEDCVRAMVNCFETEPNAAVVSAPLRKRNGKPDWQASAWPLRGIIGELMHSGPLTRRLFRRKLSYPDRYFQNAMPYPVHVDAVHGSLLMVDADRFMAAGGYDEQIFLYNEETVLAFKMREYGSKTLLLTNHSYLHKGSATISTQFDAVKRQKLRQASERYYYRHYLEASPVQMAVCWLFQKLVLWETALWLGKAGKHRKKNTRGKENV